MKILRNIMMVLISVMALMFLISLVDYMINPAGFAIVFERVDWGWAYKSGTNYVISSLVPLFIYLCGIALNVIWWNKRWVAIPSVFIFFLGLYVMRLI